MALLEHVNDTADGLEIVRPREYFDASVTESFGEDAVQGGFQIYHHYLVEAGNIVEAEELIKDYLSDFFDDGEDEHLIDENGVYAFYDGQNLIWMEKIERTTPEKFMMERFNEVLIKKEVTGDEDNRRRTAPRSRIHIEEESGEQHGGIHEAEREPGGEAPQD